MRFTYLLACLVFYITLSAAWPWPANLFIRDSAGKLTPRDDPAPSSSAAPASSAKSDQPTKTDSSNSNTASGSSKPTSTGNSDSNNGNKGNSTTAQSSSVSITQAEAGGVSMVMPAATTTTYYKIGDNVTWVWNYTSLAVTPSAVNVIVSCNSLAATYTIATNMSVNATATVVWNTAEETSADPQLDTNKYTLAIYDAGEAAGPTQTVAPGKLGVWDQFTFGMYTPQPYNDLNDGYQCVTCNGALSSAERQTLTMVFGMATITVISFTYFSTGFLGV